MAKVASPSARPFGIDVGDIVEAPGRRSRGEVVGILSGEPVVIRLQASVGWPLTKKFLKRDWGVPVEWAIVRFFVGGERSVMVHKLKRIGCLKDHPLPDDALQVRIDLVHRRCLEAATVLKATRIAPEELLTEIVSLQHSLPDVYRPLAVQVPEDPFPNSSRHHELVEPYADPGGHLWVIDTDSRGKPVAKEGRRPGETYPVKIHTAKAKRIIPNGMGVIPRRPNARVLNADNIVTIAATSHVAKGTLAGALGGHYGEPPVEGAIFRLVAEGREFLVRVDHVQNSPEVPTKLAIAWTPVALRTGLDWVVMEATSTEAPQQTPVR